MINPKYISWIDKLKIHGKIEFESLKGGKDDVYTTLKAAQSHTIYESNNNNNNMK